jgi:hypothetical protein
VFVYTSRVSKPEKVVGLMSLVVKGECWRVMVRR